MITHKQELCEGTKSKKKEGHYWRKRKQKKKER